VTEKNQTKTVFPFVHFTSIIGNGDITNSTDDTYSAKMNSLSNTKSVGQFHVHDPLPPEIITLDNIGGLPADDAQQ
ncbi:hypothetical protein, partial [Latilactobacillus curvatus]